MSQETSDELCKNFELAKKESSIIFKQLYDKYDKIPILIPTIGTLLISTFMRYFIEISKYKEFVDDISKTITEMMNKKNHE